MLFRAMAQRSAGDELRRAVSAWRADEARERVARWRGDPSADAPLVVVRRHRWLFGPQAADALGEARERGHLSLDEAHAVEVHITRARGKAELAVAQQAWAQRLGCPWSVDGQAEAAGSVVSRMLRAPAGPLREQLARVAAAECAPLVNVVSDSVARAREASATAPAHPDVGDRDAWLEQAEVLLGATDDIAHEASEHVARGPALADLLAGLRVAELDDAVPRRQRFRRIAGRLAGLGFDRELGARVKVEAAHGGPDPGVRLALLAAPMDVRLSPARGELGVVSEVLGSEGLGRALAHALSAPALPVALRHPVDGTVARAIGGLFAQTVRERRAAPQLSARVVSRLRMVAGAFVILETRALAALATLPTELAGDARAEAARELLVRALGVDVPRPLAALWSTSPALPARLRGRLGSLAAWVALRESFDEDWYRNPRAAEPLRAAAARGGGLSVEAWLQELGVEASASASRLLELFPG